jgi:hypothetical protein
MPTRCSPASARPGSSSPLSHGTTDFHPPEVTTTAAAAYDAATAPLVLRPAPRSRRSSTASRRTPGPGPGTPVAPRDQAEASRAQEDRHLRRRRREDLTARDGCPS